MNMTHFNAAPTVSAPSISSASMLVELSISVWTARKKDRSATADVLSQNHAVSSAGNFNKNLLADCDELVALQKFASNARTAHYHMTMPWSDMGMRLLPTAKYFDYHKAMTALHGEFNKLVDKFLATYDWEVMQQQAKLGTLFDRDEYPTVDQLRRKFSFNLSYTPVPDVGDWRVDIENDAVVALREQYSTFYQTQMERAMRDVWERLHTEVSRFINQLSIDAEGKKGKIYESTIEHVVHLTDMLEAANFTNDPSLQLAQRRLKSALHGVDRDTLVRNEDVRAETKRAMEEAIKALPSLDM